MTLRHVVMLIALSAIWGSSFMFIKIAVREMEPSVLVAARLLLAGATLALLVPTQLSLRRAAAQLRPALVPLTLLAIVNAVVPFWLLAWGETRIDSGLAALLQASTPLFTALLAFLFVRSEHAGGVRLLGIVIGFAGVALLVGAAPDGDPLGAVAVVGTGLCYAVGALVAVRRFDGISPVAVAFGSTVVATAASLPFALAQLPPEMPGWKATASVLVLGVLGLGLAYVLYFELLTGAGASRGVLVTYLVPPMALAYGAAFLDESVTLTALAGLVLILGGVALGSGILGASRRAAPAAAP